MEIPNQLKDAIAKENLVIFAGAGLSKKFQLPNWEQMVIELIKKINKSQYEDFIPLIKNGLLTPLEVIDKLKPEHNEIKKYIKEKFDLNKQISELHKKLLKLTNQIVTTNYDNAFELVADSGIEIVTNNSPYNITQIHKSTNKYILKLHGTFSEPDNCLIFSDDYNKIYQEDSPAKEKLKSIFSEKTILFIGFSFNDSDLNNIFESMNRIFKNHNKHFILIEKIEKIAKYDFIETIKIDSYDEIEKYIDACIKYKDDVLNDKMFIDKGRDNYLIKNYIPKISILFPNSIDINFNDEILNVKNCFDGILANIYIGILNQRTLSLIDNYDLLIIITKKFKDKLYIEDDNLQSSLCSLEDIVMNVSNEDIPIVLITNEPYLDADLRAFAYISTFNRSIIKKFIFKSLKRNEFHFIEPEIKVNDLKKFTISLNSGDSKYQSIYHNNKNLEIGIKSLHGVVGRIEEQSIIALKLLAIIKTNRILNIKASGGTGKTTIIKKVAYELYNRGYYSQGISFRSCENIKSYNDFEESLVNAFNLINIVNFKEYLIQNYNSNKIDLLIIFDNFETIQNNIEQSEYERIIEILKFSSDFANIVITSREKIVLLDNYEDLYSLPPLFTDDALTLFVNNYGNIDSVDEVRILRSEILEDLLNNNPLAIKLVTKSRPRFKHISELRDQIKNHFFESINEDYTIVFKNNADLNIERTRSIYQSINYSYSTLSTRERTAFELLSLFPDGISLSNFKVCFEKKHSSNNISDKELRVLRDKSLVEDYNGNLQLQPIIRRFADYQFSKRSKSVKSQYCSDSYIFNAYVLDSISFIRKRNGISSAYRLYSNYKNNILNVLNYIREVNINKEGPIGKKEYLLNFIYSAQRYVISEKQIAEFHSYLNKISDYFSDLINAETFLKVIDLNKSYLYEEFENSFKELNKIFSIEEMTKRVFIDEEFIERRYKDLICNIYSMEGYTIEELIMYINNNNYSEVFNESSLFYLGITDNIKRKIGQFYFYEYQLMFNKLEIDKLEKYISSLYMEDHLEIMQCTYTLSKVKELDMRTIQKLVVTNPYTKGLKHLMMAFNERDNIIKKKYFNIALENLFHIKYYYVEAIYYYCLHLKDIDIIKYEEMFKIGSELSKKFYYQYLAFLFENINNSVKSNYIFNYEYYPISSLRDYVIKHNKTWEKEFRENQVEI
jgi:hypothetical protein